MGDSRDDALIPATPSPRVRAAFAALVARMVRKNFHAVRVAQDSHAVLKSIEGGSRPALVVLNHVSWWDPIVGILLWKHFFPSREPFGPIDRDELRRFAIFKKVGLFGIDPDDPRALAAMRSYLVGESARAPRLALLLTPQGRFADVREEVVPRPGAAAMAAALGVDRAVSVAVEYAFWVDQKPEIFLRAQAMECSSAGVLEWQRRISSAMRENQRALAELVRARDAAAFESFAPRFAPKVSGTNPVYDLWLRLTGRGSDALGTAREERTPR